MTESAESMASTLEQVYRDARKAGLSISQAFAEIAEVLHEFLRQRVDSKEQDLIVGPEGFNVASVVGAMTGNPAVQLEVEGRVVIVEVGTARNFANNVLEAAATAVHDASVLRWLQVGGPGLSKQAAQAAITELRRFRGDDAQRKEPTDG